MIDNSHNYNLFNLYPYRFSITTSNQLAISCSAKNDSSSYRPLNYADVLYLGTRGSAAVTGLDSAVGALEVGMKFDALR